MIPDEFFDPAAPLYEGQRFIHPNCCEGKDRALVVTRTPQGWKWYCHRCKKYGKKPVKSLSPKEYQIWQQNVQIKPVSVDVQIELPVDYTRDIKSFPPDALAWLMKYGIEGHEVITYKIGYSPYLDRVILPVYENGELLYWQGRYLKMPTLDNPKYMNVFKKARGGIYFKRCDYGGPDVALVEDYLSAIKVGRQVDAYALLYAYLPDGLILELSAMYDRIWLWLDLDKRGKVVQHINRYRSFGINTRLVPSDKDPKAYSDREIEQYLEV